ncbi:uncharacterized protein N0V89_010333 [Didymosphaeria variabile]|uniref:Uncharacterized protein n=1 Tax=Didymosphaeria variabile TaxID=1932322 RepID=A0A9W8XB33_9PLEO|nr:uncharacterized protein N0V89_010333 [Didymosphaeria variabile]KAJ4346404.1 hypothetical protein N0V89_010333 [Didymosphaeria variabile]
MIFLIGKPTRPNLDYSDGGLGLWLRLTPVPKKESSSKQASRTCTCANHSAASNTTSDGSVAPATTAPSQKTTSTAANNNGLRFLLPSAPLRLVPAITVAATKDKCEGDVEKGSEQEEKPILEAEVVDAP